MSVFRSISRVYVESPSAYPFERESEKMIEMVSVDEGPDSGPLSGIGSFRKGLEGPQMYLWEL